MCDSPPGAKNNRDRHCRGKAGLVFISDHSPSSLGPAKLLWVKRGRAPAGPIPVVTALGSLTPNPPPWGTRGRKPSHWPVFQPGLFLLSSGTGGCLSRVKSCSGTRDGGRWLPRPSVDAFEAVRSKALRLAISLVSWRFLASAEAELPLIRSTFV